ncbi:hypothetical protein N2152v2_008577 [Parachlorella kessleri]
MRCYMGKDVILATSVLERKHAPHGPQAPLALQEGTASQTVYTVRLSTGRRRGAALSDFNAGVQLCLIGKDGSGYLHKVPALHDPEEVERELHRICQVVDHSSGANCFIAIDGIDRQSGKRGSSSGGPAPTKHRFLEGGVDEVSFLGPELGPLRALLVGPEAGRWFCDEVDVYSSRTGHTDRFICREFLGERTDTSAAYLIPISPDAVVYGSGDDAVVLSKEQAAQLYALNMAQYGDLKTRLLAINAGLVAIGTAAIFAHSGSSLAAPFALGGSSGMVYQFLLMAGVDSLGYQAGAAPYKAQAIKPGPSLALQLALASPTMRTAAKFGGVAASFLLLHMLSSQTGVAEEPGGELKQLLAAFAGFLMYKWAIIGAAVMPDQQLHQALSGGVRGKSKVDDKLD